jgi:hypothetical protein
LIAQRQFVVNYTNYHLVILFCFHCDLFGDLHWWHFKCQNPSTRSNINFHFADGWIGVLTLKPSETLSFFCIRIRSTKVSAQHESIEKKGEEREMEIIETL